MKRWFVLLLAVVVGCSSSGATTADERSGRSRSVTTADGATSTTATSTTTSTSLPQAQEREAARAGTTSTSIGEPEAPGPAVVFRPGGLPDDFAELASDLDGVNRIGLVESAALNLVESRDHNGDVVDRPPEGFVMPVDAIAFESRESAEIFSPELAEALAALSADGAVLGESSARVRRLQAGATLSFDDGTAVAVVAILPDELVGRSEAILVGVGPLPAPEGAVRRVAFVEFDGTNRELEEALAPILETDTFRIFGGREEDEPSDADRAGGEDQGRRGRAILPLLAVKELFGEFAFRPTSGGRVEIDPAWVEDNIVTVELPLLGPTRCHRLFAETLREVLQGLVDDGLADVIDRSAFEGCWNPRFIAGSTRLSRHAWGVAADINFGNPLDGGPGSPVHRELLDRMAAAGVTSGHDWTNPDPGHFEYFGSD